MASTKVGTGLDAPISSRTEGAGEAAAKAAQQEASPGKGKASAGLASLGVPFHRSSRLAVMFMRPPMHHFGR